MSEVDRSQWVVDLNGRAYPTYPYVLAEAHMRGLSQVKVALIQVPSAENGNMAIVKATVVLGRGDEEQTFEAYGDASPANVKSRIATALLRMAETRAKGRALRDACNIGQTLLEELPEEEHASGNGHRTTDRSSYVPAVQPSADLAVKHSPPCEACGKPLSVNEFRYSQHHFGNALCKAHAQEESKRRNAAAAA